MRLRQKKMFLDIKILKERKKGFFKKNLLLFLVNK